MTPATLQQAGLDTQKVQQMLYGDIDGYSLSKRGREKVANFSENMTYGEVTPEVMEQLMTAVDAAPGEVFYDLGAGTGKAVIYAALMSDLQKSTGIELLEELHAASQLAASRYRDQVLPLLPDAKHQQSLAFVRGDMLATDFSDANIVFIHCTCFSMSLMDPLTEKFNQLKSGTRVITVSKGLHSPCYTPICTQECPMAWGSATAYCYVKK